MLFRGGSDACCNSLCGRKAATEWDQPWASLRTWPLDLICPVCGFLQSGPPHRRPNILCQWSGLAFGEVGWFRPAWPKCPLSSPLLRFLLISRSWAGPPSWPAPSPHRPMPSACLGDPTQASSLSCSYEAFPLLFTPQVRGAHRVSPCDSAWLAKSSSLGNWRVSSVWYFGSPLTLE